MQSSRDSEVEAGSAFEVALVVWSLGGVLVTWYVWWRYKRKFGIVYWV